MDATTAIQRVSTASGDEAWQVTDYELVRRLLADDRLGHAHPDPDNAARSSRSAILGGPSGNYESEHAEHARTRALLLPHFSVKLMATLRPGVETLTGTILDRLAETPQPADLVSAVATPLSVLVICELLGVPPDDQDRFRTWSRDAGRVDDPERSARGMAKLTTYGRRLVADKRARPNGDLISRLCRQESLSDAEIAELAVLLLFAGHESMIMQIGLGALHLLANVDQWQALCDNPGLIDSAVEEILRATGASGGGVPRYAREDMTIGGVRIRAGELIMLDVVAANHDSSVFHDPDRFDITRTNGRHLAFGQGSNYCIGAPLARVELRTLFGQLVTRFPRMRLAVRTDELRFQTNQLTRGLVELPVVW